jgi:tetratricopeptide (TPR) repeat protein
MNRFIRELRRREVFRSAGLYVGVSWILIEGASVVLPAFEAPDWAMRAIIIAAIVGFPIMLVLAWIYDVSSEGIEVQADATDTIVVPFGGRHMDFVVIGLLSVALVFALYMNFSRTGGPVEQPDPISILIADFANSTGEPLFDGTLEQTLSIGIEGASFVTAFNRMSAQSQIKKLKPDGKLDDEGARLIAVREGIKLILAGGIREEGGRYVFDVRAVDPTNGETIFGVQEVARDRSEVLKAVAEASNQIREDLGDTKLKEESLRSLETFTASSLEAAHAYTQAQNLAYLGDYEAAIGLYKSAVDNDPEFGRAYSGWAVAAHHLGRSEEAEELWARALTFMESMTERERFRTQGLYFMVVSQNYRKAIENFEQLVENYPADGAGYNNLAVSYFKVLDFERAMEEAHRVLKIYPNSVFYQLNAALFSMYAGDFEAAEQQGRDALAIDESRAYGWLPIAMSAMSKNDFGAAIAAYGSMAATGSRGASMANLGLADISILRGQYDQAVERLTAGIEADVASGNQQGAASKYLAMAEAHLGSGNADAARQAIADALAIRSGTSQQVAAALLYVELGQLEDVRAIADSLREQLQPQNRAYGTMLLGVIDSIEGRHADALDKLSSASQLADFWLVRMQLGKAYFRAGSFAEALDEFTACETRRGEASAVFLDDLPSWRYHGTLPYWRGRAQQEVGMLHAATQSYIEFLGYRNDDSPMVTDAKARQAAR